MHVVFSSIDNDGAATGFIDQDSNDSKKFFLKLLFNQGISVLRRKHGLNVKLRVGIGHLLFILGRNKFLPY